MQLAVPYRGDTTIAGLTTEYADRMYLPLRDEMFGITLTDIRTITVEFADIIKPQTTRDSGEVFPKTGELIEALKGSGHRGLNVPETLALGNVEPDAQFVCLGQMVPTQFGMQTLYIIRRGAGLLPITWSWSASWRVPATRDPDPLVEAAESLHA